MVEPALILTEGPRHSIHASQPEMDELKLSLCAAGNTCNPALITLQAKGYRLWAEALKEDGQLWCASKEGRQFAGYSPLELLGLVALWEHFGDHWNQQAPDLLGDLLDRLN